MKKLLLDKDILTALSGWFLNLSAGWFASIFILPIFADPNPFFLLTVNGAGAIVTLIASILITKRSKKL
jgi:hypothetical protein